MQTINLKIEDSVYNEIVKSGINIQEELKKTLTKLVSNNYMQSQQYKDDKQYFNDALSGIESDNEDLVTHSEVWEQIEAHAKAN